MSVASVSGSPSVVILGSGIAVPKLRFSNEDLASWHGRKSAAWLEATFGVRHRHAVYDYRNDRLTDEDDNDLAIAAGRRALAAAGTDIGEIDALLLASGTPAYVVAPDNACVVHQQLGARRDAAAFMHTAGCAGMLNVMKLGAALIRSGEARRVLVCASNTISSYVRRDLVKKVWMQASIFGDAAAALVLAADDGATGRGFGRFHMGAEHARDVAFKKYGGSKHPPAPDDLGPMRDDAFVFDYRRVPDNLRETFTEMYREALQSPELGGQSPDWILFNMSNGAIQRQWVDTMELPIDKFVFNMAEYGNCAAASVGLVVHDWLTQKKPAPGQTALVMTVGTGLQFGWTLYRVP